MNKLLFACLTAIVILFAGCNKEPYNEEKTEPGSLYITIENENATEVRVIGNEPSETTENTVHSFAVFVFNSTDQSLEKAKVFLNSTTGRVDKLNPGTKRVVALVNAGDYSFIDNVQTYSDLDDMTLNLDSQIPGDFATYGLFMSGESPNITLNADEERSIEIPVSRVVAKVRLESLTITPDPGSTLANFKLVGVCVQKVPYFAYMLGDVIPTLDDGEYIGGLGGSVSTIIQDKARLLYEDLSTFDITQTIRPEVYFYVFPNDNAQGRATLLTIYGMYNNLVLYYTFPINSSNVNGGDGKYIERNKVYTMNITLKDVRNGLFDPDGVSPTAVLLATVRPENWAGHLVENAEW